jgi:hypothetical protein
VITFDVAHVFREFDGPSGLLRALDKHQPDHDLAYPSIQMWKQRGSIPTKWLPAVLYCIEKTGRHCLEFLIDNDEMGLASPPRKSRARSRR